MYDQHPVMKISHKMFEKLLDDIDGRTEQLSEDLSAPYLTRRFAQATSVQLTLIDISDDAALTPAIRERASKLLRRLIERVAARAGESH